MTRVRLLLAALSLSMLAGCTNPYDPAQRAVGGGLLGAGAGAAIGGIAGGGHGAAIGALATFRTRRFGETTLTFYRGGLTAG